ncbi:doublecortin domain-containing protein 2 isoform X1 [Synchiropus splendidus]|uniref:doublecortin domain-containing protein 2 isoform X1 n=2 Tax=Synchiropus splendidus TaxID=270530 RepID=UPI00237DF158|nr:doublecortin domain-containing protein 2 isoform X1 [Synchiropus splendidus]
MYHVMEANVSILISYGEGASKKQQSKSMEKICPVVHSRLLVSARWQKTADESCTINVFTNGQILVPPARVRIPKYTLRSWEKVLTMVAEKVNLRTGAVIRLCTLDGCAICGSYELQNHQYYVAVGAEKFKALPYSQCVPGRDIMRRNIVEHSDINPAARKKRHAKTVFPIGSFGEDLENAGRGRIKKDTAQSERSNQQRQVSTNPVSLSIGEGSVFNAQNKRSEIVGAAEVPDDRQLKVDLPIDQVEAKTVDEDGSCSTNPSVTPRHDSGSSTLLKSPAAGSTENGTQERAATSRLVGPRSRMSRFLKESVPNQQMGPVLRCEVTL